MLHASEILQQKYEFQHSIVFIVIQGYNQAGSCIAG